MKNTYKAETGKCYLSSFPNYVRHILLILFFLMGTQIYAQQEIKLRSFNIQAGLNGSILSGGMGPSFSFHYALRTEKVLQPESMLFFDSQSGETFLTGESQDIRRFLSCRFKCFLLKAYGWYRT